ncbi:hypothetical protein [Streptomyces sp. NBC_00893]|uniref:hypothetical protein n=1 Tax=Streptomyces sp. NBC_00893 TaxID=2975862 RepID=UPI0022533152|nr:hypothetical protein [Streptomyces sp. NBC_00893]MCX4850990.1 hypothetical protein [Streptomyces sp. NBC_00893]
MRLPSFGADPWLTKLVFRDQIEANKAVQRGLYRLWRDHPSGAPTGRPRLDDVRKEVDRLNEALVRAVADTAPYRRAAPLSRVAPAVSAGGVSRERSLDELHSTVLAGSLQSVCGSRRHNAG